MNTPSVNSERILYSSLAVWFLLVTFLGFSFTFYIPQTTEPLPFHLNLHGIIFSCWVLLFFVQTSLISIKKVQIHMKLGLLGVLLLLLMIPSGFYAVLYKVSAGTKTIDHGGYNLFTLSAGYLFVAFALLLRKKAFYHKRLMLFGMIIFTTASIDRVAFIFELEQSQLFRKSLVLLPSLLLFLFDYIKFKKYIWVDLLPLLVIFLLFYGSDYFWMSDFGENVMRFLIRWV